MESDAAPATAGDGNTLPDRTAPAARATYRLLNVQGFGRHDAGNLTAYLHGLTPVESGWRLVEIERLLFLRHLVEHGHMEPSLADAPAHDPGAGIPQIHGRKDS